MYVALRETFDVDAAGQGTRVFPGQEVKSFLTWPARNQMAALSARIVREVPDGAAMPPDEMFARQPRADIDAAKRSAMVASAPGVAEAAAGVQFEEASVAEVAEAVAPAAPAGQHACDEAGCGFSSPSERGLRIHQAAHAKKPR